MDRHRLLRSEGSNLSDVSTTDAFPSTPQKRYGYRRKKISESVELMPTTSEIEVEDKQSGSLSTPERLHQGLGISGTGRQLPIHRVPVGAKSFSPSTLASPFTSHDSVIKGTTATPEVSPLFANLTPSPAPSNNVHRGNTNHGDSGGSGYLLEGLSPPYGHSRASSFPEDSSEPCKVGGATMRLKRCPSSNSHDENPTNGCPTKHDPHTSRSSWLSITLLLLSLYSTTMSMLWLITALVQPRWGRQIYSGGSLTPSTASLLSALIAKTIELSFVTVFISFLGQTLSRKSIAKWSRGITIAEMSMRTWVIQPGFMLTHWQTLRYAGWSILGVISLIAAVSAMLYTTASDALVSPKLQYGRWEYKLMQGLVLTSYANSQFVEQICQTPIDTVLDSTDSATTCLAIENAGDSFHNFMTWLTTWATISNNGTGESSDILSRPQGIAMLYDNTTVQGNWIMPSNMSASYEQFGHIINNVTVAMPHANVFAAARDPINNIMQPDELDGVGGYSIRASVPSPSMNVLCVNVAKTELAPLVYAEWEYAKTNASDIPGQKMPYSGWLDDVTSIKRNASIQYLNSTPVDNIFQWGKKYIRRPPVFPMFPLDYNTVISEPDYPEDALYILAKNAALTNYTLCSIRSFLYPNCSTYHDVSGTAGGSSLASHCDDPDDKEAYALSQPNSPISISSDWAQLAFAWATSVGLKDGSVNGNASIARLLTQLVPQKAELPSLTPSMAEALAVLGGNTLLLGTTASTFLHYWSFAKTRLNPGVYLTFNASVATQQYTSSYTQGWQAAFYPVLFIVAIINMWCLAYYFRRSGLITDYTEPQNLFALAINSPFSEGMAGSCGAGPEREQFQIDWKIKMAAETAHYYIEQGEMGARKIQDRAVAKGYEFEHAFGQSRLQSPYNSYYDRTSSYLKLSNTRSLL